LIIERDRDRDMDRNRDRNSNFTIRLSNIISSSVNNNDKNN